MPTIDFGCLGFVVGVLFGVDGCLPGCGFWVLVFGLVLRGVGFCGFCLVIDVRSDSAAGVVACDTSWCWVSLLVLRPGDWCGDLLGFGISCGLV